MPRLTEARRAGLLAAVTVFPLSRMSGTLPRPAVDRALVSGASMAAAFFAADATTAVLRRAVISGASSELQRDRRTAAVTALVAVGAGAMAHRVRTAARARAAEGERIPVSEGALGTTAELVTVSAAAGCAVALADVIGGNLPAHLQPRNPVIVLGGVVAAGAALAAVSRHPRVLEYLSVPGPDDAESEHVEFQRGSSLPVAVARAAGVAAVSVGALALETHAASWIGGLLDGSQTPGPTAVLAGHAVVAVGAVGAGLGAFAFYSSRVAVHEQLLESAYAAAPQRTTVTGGPHSVYEFGDPGREGRRFVSQCYSATELEAVLDRPTRQPVRVFLPLSAQSGSAEQDAAMLVAEIERLGGFDRGVLVLSAPTGDGYVSYVHTETVELLTEGDCATAVVQYNQVPSAVAFPMRRAAAAAFAVHARAVATRARELNPRIRLFVFGESLGSIVALDAFGPDVAKALAELGYEGGLYVGVPIFSKTDQALRPRSPEITESAGLQYAADRLGALAASPGHLNLTHPTDPVGTADPTVAVRHPVDYWGRPGGVFIPAVTFLVTLADVKNAMNLKPGNFEPSPGHDYRYETAAAVARAYDLPLRDEALIENALRERELAWSVRRLIARRLGTARDTVLSQLQSWGVDPSTLTTRFEAQRETLPEWLATLMPPPADAPVPPLPGQVA